MAVVMLLAFIVDAIASQPMAHNPLRKGFNHRDAQSYLLRSYKGKTLGKLA